MCRAIVIALLLCLGAAPALAQGINFKDQKSVDAEIERRVKEKMQAFQPEIERQKKLSEEYAKRFQQQMPQQIPQAGTGPVAPTQPAAPIVTFECKKTGCNQELCSPAMPDGSGAPGALTTCDRLTFYDCYKTATCSRVKDSSGKIDLCRWVETPELRSCLQAKGGAIGLSHAGLK